MSPGPRLRRRGPAAGNGRPPQRGRPGVVAGPSPRLAQLQPLVPPQVLHFMQVPLRTSV